VFCCFNLGGESGACLGSCGKRKSTVALGGKREKEAVFLRQEGGNKGVKHQPPIEGRIIRVVYKDLRRKNATSLFPRKGRREGGEGLAREKEDVKTERGRSDLSRTTARRGGGED